MPTKVRSMERNEKAPYEFKGGVLTVRLHVQPGASRSGWAGLHGGHAMRLRVAAPAVEGKANAACVAFLAEALAVPRRSVSIVRGAHGREKTVRITGVSLEQFQWLREQFTL